MYLLLEVISLSCLNQETFIGRDPETLQSRWQEPPTTLSAFRRGFVKNGGRVRSVPRQRKKTTMLTKSCSGPLKEMSLCSKLEKCYLKPKVYKPNTVNVVVQELRPTSFMTSKVISPLSCNSAV